MQITNIEILRQIKGQDNRFNIKDYLKVGDEILTYDCGESFKIKVKERKEDEIIFEIAKEK